MRRRITADLSARLDPVFRSPGSVPSPLLAPDGNTYIEHAINPVGSEAYTEAIREFLDANADSMSDYRLMTAARTGWCFWTRVFSWLVFALLLWELAVLAVLLLDKVSFWVVLDGINCAAWCPTSLLVAACIVAVACRFVFYDKMTRLRVKHGDL